MDLAERVRALIEPTIVAMGYDIVRIVLTGKQQLRLQIMAEARDGTGMTADRCAAISRAISAILEEKDPIDSAYTLEVSSPGIDRPLIRLGDFERFAGLEARLETVTAIDGRRKFTGRLLGVDGEIVRLNADGAELAVPFADIRRAKLVLTDELLKAAPSRSLS